MNGRPPPYSGAIAPRPRSALALIALLPLAATLAGCGEREAPAPEAGAAADQPAVVERVSDGDTVRVRAGGDSERVRLLGIDAPEVAHPDAPAECFGPQAAGRAARLLPPGTRVRLVGDPTQDARDRFGRRLAYVYRPGDPPERPVNALLVADGYARVYPYGRRPFLQLERFRRAEARARGAGAGLWGACRRGG